MRLNAFLSRAGVASRRGADELIRAGRVVVNGEPGRFDHEVGRRDHVKVDGARVELQPLTYVLLDKPAGAITTARDPQGRPTVVDLVGHDVQLAPVGRLDVHTTGLLLLTNDGDLAHRLAHPRYGVEKVYLAEVDGDPDADTVRRLARGRRARRRHDGTGARPPARAGAARARAARGPQPPGAPDVRGGRPPGAPTPAHRLRGPERSTGSSRERGETSRALRWVSCGA